MKMTKNCNLFLVLIVFIILVGGSLYSLLFSRDINEYENRTAYTYHIPSIKTVFNKEFQDNIELTLGDQIPLSTTMKKSYNAINAIANYNIMKKVTKDYCKNNYVSMIPGLSTFGCDDIIVYYPRDIELQKDMIDSRIENINEVTKKGNVETFIYYIEKDTDIDFKTNKKTNVSSYIKQKVETDKFHIFKINNFKEFNRDFYKTDHHWNLNGSYRAYMELAELLKINDVIEKGKKQCITNSFTGSKANVSGASLIFKEDFCIYEYDMPKHTITINGEKAEFYSARNINDIQAVSYATGYGNDYAEIIIDYNQKKKENILVFGESYDNALLELIGSHFNKTHSIDLRHYERTYNKKFDYEDYIKENDINKVLFIGNIDFFVMEEFNLEVK